MIRVALVDDQQLVRTGFAMLLESQDDIAVAWQASDGAEAVQLAAANPVDVILMDVQMPVLDGIGATAQIIAAETGAINATEKAAVAAANITPAQHQTRILMLTTFDSENYVMGAITAGASGFLLKDTDPQQLLEAIRTTSDSAAIISPAATARLIRAMRENNQQTAATAAADGQQGFAPNLGLQEMAEQLTPREREILTLIAKGYTNTEIAAELFISLPTVKTHVGKVLYKTCSRDRVHAVLFALGSGVVTPAELLTGK